MYRLPISVVVHERWSSPLLSHSRSLDPAFDLRPSQYNSFSRDDHHSVSEDNYSPDRYTKSHGLHRVYSRGMQIRVHAWTDTEEHKWGMSERARGCFCTCTVIMYMMPLALNSLETDVWLLSCFWCLCFSRATFSIPEKYLVKSGTVVWIPYAVHWHFTLLNFQKKHVYYCRVINILGTVIMQQTFWANTEKYCVEYTVFACITLS